MASLQTQLTELATTLREFRRTWDKDLGQRQADHDALTAMGRDMGTLLGRVANLEKAEEERAKERSRRGWAVLLGVILALLGVASTVAAALILASLGRREPPKVSGGPAMGSRVLVLDDEPGVARAFARALERRGHVVLTSPSAEDALSLFRAGRFDALVVDFRLPGADGLSFVREVRRIDAKVGVVMVTGADRDRVDRECEGLGVLAVLSKPVKEGQLEEAVGEAAELAGIEPGTLERLERDIDTDRRELLKLARGVEDETKILPPRGA